MFTKTVLTTLALTGLLVKAATVSSSSGVVYNCPNIETIEVAYAQSCPTQSKNSLFQLTGTSSTANYGNAPDNYRVDNGLYNLLCLYGKTASGQDVEPLECRYTSGSGQALTASANNNAECPDVGQTFPAPSPTPTPTIERKSLGKRVNEAPQYNCPWDSNTDGIYTFQANIGSGSQARSDSPVIYQCAIHTNSDPDTSTCVYTFDGMLDTRTSNAPDCPQQLCTAKKDMRRSLKRGVYVQDNPIHSRQVKASSLREAGKKRMPKPSSK